MKKTSLYLPDELDRALAQRASDDGLSKAEYIRRSLESVVQRQQRPKLSRAVFSSAERLDDVESTSKA